MFVHFLIVQMVHCIGSTVHLHIKTHTGLGHRRVYWSYT